LIRVHVDAKWSGHSWSWLIYRPLTNQGQHGNSLGFSPPGGGGGWWGEEGKGGYHKMGRVKLEFPPITGS
jgi:hypothetical protein